MPTQPTPTTLPDLLRFYLRGALDPHSFNTHLLLILIDQAEGQALLRALVDETIAELQVQAQDIAALATQRDVALPSQQRAADDDAADDKGDAPSPDSTASTEPDNG
jgi:hypothetical protein